MSLLTGSAVCITCSAFMPLPPLPSPATTGKDQGRLPTLAGLPCALLLCANPTPMHSLLSLTSQQEKAKGGFHPELDVVFEDAPGSIYLDSAVCITCCVPTLLQPRPSFSIFIGEGQGRLCPCTGSACTNAPPPPCLFHV